MKSVSTTKMSSKGQVVIPESIRKNLNLEAGTRFVVVGEGDVVILKAIASPSLKAFDSVIKKARQQAREAGLTKSDIEAVIADVRKAR